MPSPDRSRLPARRLPLLAASLLVVGACISPDSDVALERLPDPAPAPAPQPARIDTDDGSDWVRLESGEWIKGEVVVLDRETLVFDSADLDELEIDWSDVAEVRAPREFTVLLEGQLEATGTVRVEGDEVYLTDDAGTRHLPRAALVRMVPGQPSEANAWSGELSLGGTTRSGNTDQVDVTSSLSLLRRTARSRFTLDYDVAYGELEGQRSTDNHRLVSQVDRFLGARLFVTPIAVDLYRDRFQNLDLRASVNAALGYRLVDSSELEWDVSAGPGYRTTRYDSVPAGTDDEESTATGNASTKLSWDPTSRLDVSFTYDLEVGLRDTTDTNQTATLGLSVDLWSDLDLDVRMRWDHVGQPRADANGVVPEKDDYQLTVGLSWSF